ncbi:MAG: hypothetical protein IOB85_05965 [Methylobacterium sp.]|nr:hypothetical protein [Methylobacterium sp.]MCA3659015.1 hypothetical protein [Methylobacterium sp.]MCA3661177.1 hypothetical protein [Methylobacterium sp.]MCA3663595.1 hypothetical protein [Methylobacterium sp.]MCA3667249.1 hypothetical protein [Methylobacterium sp.]
MLASMHAFFPDWTTASIAALYNFAAFESQRWIRARLNGIRGASERIGLFVDTTGTIKLIFLIVFMVGYIYDFGFVLAIKLFLIMVLIPLTAVVFLSIVRLADSPLFWILGTVFVWPLMYLLGKRISWFGLA